MENINLKICEMFFTIIEMNDNEKKIFFETVNNLSEKERKVLMQTIVEYKKNEKEALTKLKQKIKLKALNLEEYIEKKNFSENDYNLI